MTVRSAERARELIPQIAFVCEQRPKAFVYWSAPIGSCAPKGIRTMQFGTAPKVTSGEGEFWVTGCEDRDMPAGLTLGAYIYTPGLIQEAMLEEALTEDIEAFFKEMKEKASLHEVSTLRREGKL